MPKVGSALYLIALIPPSPIFEDASELKNLFKEKYGSRASLNSPPHITLHMPFEWKERKEGELLSKLSAFSKDKETVELELRNFSCFAPRVIFINVLESKFLRTFQNELHRFCKVELNIFNAQYKDMPFHPHLTLAFRDLKKPMFEKAWEEFKSKEYSESFAA
ncbi:MAG: 2'-5' RNA ligase family protein, partial [Bacteroidia bacterium]|nr:2'-5' RNA ligase family protein [Bacteroidia bacterium]